MNTVVNSMVFLGAISYLIGTLWYLFTPLEGIRRLSYYLLAGTGCMLVAALLAFATHPIVLLKLILCAAAAVAVLSLAIARIKDPS